VAIADKIVEHQADYLLALKAISRPSKPRSQAISVPLPRRKSSAKPLSTKGAAASRRGQVDWTVSDRSYPNGPRFTHIKTIVKVDSPNTPINPLLSTSAFTSRRLLSISTRSPTPPVVMHWLLVALTEQLFDACADHFADIVGVTERVLKAVVYEARRRGLGLDGS
jgi:hypothetical protein